jgi:hypothetical protein
VDWEIDRLGENGRSGLALAEELMVEHKLTVTAMVAAMVAVTG